MATLAPVVTHVGAISDSEVLRAWGVDAGSQPKDSYDTKDQAGDERGNVLDLQAWALVTLLFDTTKGDSVDVRAIVEWSEDNSRWHELADPTAAANLARREFIAPTNGKWAVALPRLARYLRVQVMRNAGTAGGGQKLRIDAKASVNVPSWKT